MYWSQPRKLCHNDENREAKPTRNIHLVTNPNSIQKTLNHLMIVHQMISRLPIHIMLPTDQHGKIISNIVSEEARLQPMSNNPVHPHGATVAAPLAEDRVQVQLQMDGPLVQTLVGVGVVPGGAADHHQEEVGAVVADVLDLQVVPQIPLVEPAVLAGAGYVALPGGELGGEDAIPDTQDGGVAAGMVRLELIDCLFDRVVGEL